MSGQSGEVRTEAGNCGPGCACNGGAGGLGKGGKWLGRGMSVVADKDVTQEALMKAFVGASRPRRGCGTAGCGPAGCN